MGTRYPCVSVRRRAVSHAVGESHITRQDRSQMSALIYLSHHTTPQIIITYISVAREESEKSKTRYHLQREEKVRRKNNLPFKGDK